MPKQDPIKQVVVDQDWENVKKDVNSAMSKIKNLLLSTNQEKHNAISSLKIRGRDQIIYAFLLTLKLNKLNHLLADWNEKTWDIYYTSGLLLDMGLALSKLLPDKTEARAAFEAQFSQTRQANKLINRKSDFYKDLPDDVGTQAGVSASTWNVLQALRYLNMELGNAGREKITPIEVEAIMNGLIYFWDIGYIKRWLGQFHTAAEVWAAYNFYREKYDIKKSLPITPKL
ncbi:hypothetical protein [Pedobacter suwonensis]|uniref:hypothetical protein n=1 Tax=Pedobacter suwonensis TaxID=332999 RepID=UPI0011A6FB8F|nr:hypothetical protein [Pedobacter suwonensis]